MTGRSDSFALCGASPFFAEPLHVGRPNQPPREEFLRRVNEALDRNWLSNNGPLVHEFEERITELTGAAHCVAVSNGTTGLQAVFHALEITRPIAMPSFTFVATPASAAWLGLEPALVDIERTNYGISPAEVDRLPSLGAIVGVHVWGMPCAVDELAEIAARNGCPLILDAAHALSSTLDDRIVGTLGDAEVFSFHATKLVHSFEGGAVTTNNSSLAAELRRMINFGFVDYDTVTTLGTNSKMNEISAAMGLAMLDHLPVILERNRANRLAYDAALGRVPGVELVSPPPGSTTNDQYVVAMIDDESFGLTRDELYRVLHAENVLVRRYFYPGTHRMEPYERFTGDRSFAVSDAVADQCLAFPTGLAIDSSAIALLGDLVERAHMSAPVLRAALADED